MRNKKLLLMIALSVAVVSSAHAQRGRKASAVDANMISQSCMGCHGTDGASAAGPMPIIGGQSEGYLLETMKAFKSGARPSTIMGRLAKGYSDAELAGLAKYFAGKPFVRREQKLDPALVDAGRAAYGKACKKCHAENGRDAAEPQYPILAGQWLDVMQIVIDDINTGHRKVDDKFKAKLDELKPEEAKAALHFFAAQK